MPIPLSTPAPMRPATNVPWPSVSTRAEPPTKLFAPRILPGEVGMAGVDAGVDDRDRDRLERGQRDPRGVEAAVREVPLLRHERIARREREMARDERLDVADAARSRGARRLRARRRPARGSASGCRACVPVRRSTAAATTSALRTVREADGDAGSAGSPRQRERDRHEHDDERDPPHPVTCTTGDVPAANAGARGAPSPVAPCRDGRVELEPEGACAVRRPPRRRAPRSSPSCRSTAIDGAGKLGLDRSAEDARLGRGRTGERQARRDLHEQRRRGAALRLEPVPRRPHRLDVER